MDLSNPVTQQIVGGIIRSLIVAAGGAGIMSGDQLGVFAGAVAALIGVGWSIYQKRATAKDSHAMLTQAVELTAAAPHNADSIIAAAKAGKF